MKKIIIIGVLAISSYCEVFSSIKENIGFEGDGFSGWRVFIGKLKDTTEVKPQCDTFYSMETGKLWPSDFWTEQSTSTSLGKYCDYLPCDDIEFKSKDKDIRFAKIAIDSFPSDTKLTKYIEKSIYDKNTGILLQSPNGSKHIVRLGNSSNGYYTEKMSYSFKVTDSTKIIRYYYAIVMEDPGHDKRPYFYAAVTADDNDVNVVGCSNVSYYADTTKFSDLKVKDKIFYKNWSSNIIDLSDYVGKEVTLSFITSDCGAGVHFGYAYVDAEFVDSKFDIDGVSGSSVCAGESVTFSYPGSNLYVGESYEWRIDGQKVSNQQSFEHKFETVGSHTVSLTIKVKNESIDTNSCVVERVITDIVNVVKCFCPESPRITLDGVSLGESFSLCKDKMYDFKFAAGVPMTNPQYEWSWNSESSSSSGSEDSYSLQATQSGRLSVLMTSEECKKGVTVSVDLDVAICFTKKCNDCPSKFSPQPGEKYVISGWVSAPGQLENHATSFEKVGIQMNFSNTSGSTSTFSVAPSGSIIDGWQRISGVVTIPQDAEVMRISLVNESGSDEVYYDDIRFHPFNSTMKGYVYDPVTLRLSAELDDQNYATLYEYDDEGVLVRVKKETERGVMTIRESRQSSRKTKE